MKSGLLHALASSALFAALSATAGAQVTFTLTGTVPTDGTELAFGYTSGETVTLSLKMAASFSNNGSSGFDPTLDYWAETGSNGGLQLWTDATGTGLGGAYNLSAPDGQVDVAPENSDMTFLAQSTGGGIGLTANGTELKKIDVVVDSSEFLTFSTGSYVNPATYFSGYTGTYVLSGGGGQITNTSLAQMNFTPTILTITAIPEPATYAVLAGVAALGLVVLRRGKSATVDQD